MDFVVFVIQLFHLDRIFGGMGDSLVEVHWNSMINESFREENQKKCYTFCDDADDGLLDESFSLELSAELVSRFG